MNGRTARRVQVNEDSFSVWRSHALTEHLRRRDVQLISHDASQGRHEHDEDVDVAVEEGIRPNQEDAFRRHLVPHCQRNGNLDKQGK